VPILSPTDKAVLWQAAVRSAPDDRASLLRVLAREIIDGPGRRVELSDGHEEAIIETVQFLDASGLLDSNDLRLAFAEADDDDDHAQGFAALVAAHLGSAADTERLGVDARVRAVRLAGMWQAYVLERPASSKAEWLTAPQLAARYSVTPQAVYKWIKAGRVQAEQTPGGSWRLSSSRRA
jgi:hypothetical protein